MNMMLCGWCDQVVRTSDSCHLDREYPSIDERVIVGVKRCPDCFVAPGGCHHGGCGVERCSSCRGQAIECACDAHDPSKSRWRGERPDIAECRDLDFG